jgi:hypothetical protein
MEDESDTTLPPAGSCSIPVVVHGNLSFVNDVVPGRSCRILEPGEQLPSGTFLSGDVIVPQGGCPMIFYAGRSPGTTIYDNRALNPTVQVSDGCDVIGPSNLANCSFKVKQQSGTQLKSKYLASWVFNVEPVE